ncbi:MAG: FtsB family cell division protein [Candidatus Limnocylindria bacterium]
MTGIDLPAQAPRPSARPSRLRLPATRGGLAWMAVVLILGAFLAVQFGRQVYANWEINQRAAAIQQQIEAIEAENLELRQELAYLQSEAFIGAEARRLTNLGAEGERVLIIPPGAEEPLPASLLSPEDRPKPMLEQWLDLFFGAEPPGTP